MTLQAWIKETGVLKVRKELDVDPATVNYWKMGRSLPRPKYLVKINKLSKGRVTYAEMIETYVKKARNNNTK